MVVRRERWQIAHEQMANEDGGEDDRMILIAVRCDVQSMADDREIESRKGCA